MRVGVVIPLLMLTTAVQAQESPSYKLREHVFNAGGNPDGGAVLASAGFHVRLDAVGEGVTGTVLGSLSYRMDGGFVSAYPPPREVRNLRFSSKTTLSWDAERSAGDYDVYREILSTLPGGFGTCLQHDIPAQTAADAGVPGGGTGYFYLVTAENRLDEEGTKGFRSNGTERPNPAPCP